MTTIDYSTRLVRLRDIIGEDTGILVPGANMVYFTGLHVHLSERPVLALVKNARMAFIIPELEAPKLASRSDLDAELFVWNDREGYMGAFIAAVENLELAETTLAVDGQTMRVFEYLAFQLADSSIAVRDIGTELLQIRARKTAEEVALMRKAIEISEAALKDALRYAKPGMTERQIADRLNQKLNELGSEGFAFATTVLTGPNSALPHGTTGDRTLGEDEFLLIDFGGMVGGYPADITRTVCLGTPNEEMQRIYDAVWAANRAAREIAGPGVPAGEVDRAARQVIEEAGYGEYFIHRTGHGLGLEVHELPQIAAGVEDVLEAGMVFTIEPGIYIPEIGGVRIEDDVLITENGAEVLTSFPREIRLSL